MFHTLLLSAWTIFHIYIFWRLISLPAVRRYFSRLFLFVIIAALWSAYFLPGILNDLGLNSLSRIISLFGMNWLGTTFLIFVCLLIVDLLTLYGLILRSYLKYLRPAGFVAGILLSLIALYLGYRSPIIRNYEITLPNLPAQDDGQVLVAISDLHVGTFLDENWLSARVKQINALKPDIVVMLGDLFEGDSPSERRKSMIEILKGISAPLGVWGIVGNHESHGGLGSTTQFLEESGIQMLRDQWKEIEPGLVLAGADEHHYNSNIPGSSDRLAWFINGRPLNCATIYLSHRPVGAEEAAAAGAGLMLSGHTHGGQLWPFTYISALANPLLAGKYVIDGMPVIVSRGTGTWGPRMRLWHPGEILRITLRSPDKHNSLIQGEPGINGQ
ncbi:Metallophosphoesterase [Candidatus Zixiibacteriota bacterium]|nr:Metallophosphoesterase [candidate division Zixibacteria bacterium]